MSCLTTEELVALAVGDPAARNQDHVATCPACAARLAEIRAALAQLETALAGPDPAHAAGRARLVAALATRPAPVRPSTFRRILMDRRSWAAAAVAAALALILVYGGSSSVALADALKPFKEARSFSCEMVPLLDGQPAKGADKLTVKLTWAAPGSFRSEMLAAGKIQSVFLRPHGQPGMVIDHRDRTYTKTDGNPGRQEAAIIRLTQGLAGYPAGDQKPAGEDEINGVKAPRFDLTVSEGKKGPEWHYRVWADPKTKRPIRVEFTPQAGQEPGAKGVSTIRLDRFEWDVKTEGLFETDPPAGYKSAVLTPAEADEQTARRIVAALKAYRDAAGGYPKAEPFDPAKAAAELNRLTKVKPAAEVVQGLVLIGTLQATGQEVVYRGKTVAPDDKGKVLFRYKMADGRYRVVFGDLRTEAVTAERLVELEKQ